MFAVHKEKHKISVKFFPRIFLLALLANFWVSAQAQVHSDATGDKRSAHIKRNPDADTARFIVEQEIPTKMQMPEIQFNPCQASVTLQYHQRNTVARVETTVENESCIPATGGYELMVNILDDNGGSRNLSFSETWEQNDDTPLTFSRDYAIGENATLKRIVAQSIRCECTETGEPE